MPKEQGRLWEGAARSSSKTAKNKSNSAALQAALGSIHRDPSGMGDRNNPLVLCDGEKDSEKDSGYSGNRAREPVPWVPHWTVIGGVSGPCWKRNVHSFTPATQTSAHFCNSSIIQLQ